MPTKLHPGPVYGPIHSRRLGVSLGVNLMPASGKICTFDCLYCEDGFNAERRTHEGCVSAEEYETALEAKLREMSEAGVLPDVITFSGNGEPTAAPSFPEAVRATVRLRDQYAPGCKIAVLSNATMADRPAVREALMLVDDNILKLDTVDPDFIEFLDRPCCPYDVEHQIETLATYEGHVIVQTIFLRGSYEGRSCDNTGDEYVAPWLEALKRIAPQAVTIYTIDRPTPAQGLEKAPAEVLDAIAERVRALGLPCQVSY